MPPRLDVGQLPRVHNGQNRSGHLPKLIDLGHPTALDELQETRGRVPPWMNPARDTATLPFYLSARMGTSPLPSLRQWSRRPLHGGETRTIYASQQCKGQGSGFLTAASIVVHHMSEVWVFGGSSTQEHERDTTMYPGLDYRGPTSCSEEFFVFKSTQIGRSQRRRTRIRQEIARCYPTARRR
jgi:hypothetical protein